MELKINITIILNHEMLIYFIVLMLKYMLN